MNWDKLLEWNINNLITFWSACGVGMHKTISGSTLHISNNWPNRMWFAYQDKPNGQDIQYLLTQLASAEMEYKFPNWHDSGDLIQNALLDAGYEIGMTQELMAMELNSEKEFPKSNLLLKDVNDKDSSSLWASIASESFGYSIHQPVIQELIGLPGFDLVVAYDHNIPIGTGLLLQTGSVAGIHMIGVPPSHRRKGYARHIMYGLLTRAQKLRCEFTVLQASAAGEPLYRRLGYESQGPVYTYRKKNVS